MIVFRKIRYKNFLSVGNGFLETTLDTHDSTIIVGANGAGKSTLIVALFFALFNRPYRNVKRGNLVNSINRKNCVVEVEFSTPSGEYRVVRGIKPGIFEIYRDGELINQESNVKDYQEILERILGLDYKSFQQVVVLSSSSYTPFMQLSTPDRRQIVENLLDIGIFSSMNEITKGRLSAIVKDISDKNHAIDRNRSVYAVMKKTLEDSQNDYDELIKTLQNRSEQATLDLVDLRNREIAESKKIVSEAVLSKIRAGLKKYTDSVNIADRKKATCQDKIEKNNDFLKMVGRKVCPTCGHPISDTDKNIAKTRDGILEENASLEVEIEKCVGVIFADSRKAAEFQELLDEAVDKNSLTNYNLGEIRTKIRQNEQVVRDCNADIKKMESKRDSTVDLCKMKELEDEYGTLVAEVESLTDDRRYYESLVSMLKDDGVKSRIVQKYLPFMNERVNHYLEEMDAFFDFTLDENFNETIRSRYRDDFSYYSFSEGEKQRIDIALLLTWRDLAKRKNSVDTNLLIMDEVFDSSLDANAIDMLSTILIGTLSKDNNIIVISHNTEQMIDKFDRIIKVRKVDNFTEMEVV